MNATQFASRKSAGMCAASMYCPNPATHGVLCGEHREMARHASRKSNNQWYWRHKRLGLCTTRGCYEQAGDTGKCEPHREKQNAVGRSLNKRAWRRKQLTAAQKRRAKLRIAEGLCIRCNEPSVTKLLCEKHRRMALEDWRRRTGKQPTWKLHCSNCGEPNHTYLTCQKRGNEPGLSLAEYATAKRPVEVL